MLASIRQYLWLYLLYVILAILALGTAALSLQESILLTRSEIPISRLLLTPYSPLYLFVLHVWALISQDLIWLRLLGVLLGLLALVLSPEMLRSLGGTHATRGAMWLLCASPFLVAEVGVLSSGPLALVLVAIAYLCFQEYTRAGQLGWLAAWMGTVMAATLVHGGLYYLAVIQSLAMLFYRQRFANKQRYWWLAQILPLLLFALLFGAQFNRFIADRITEVSSAPAAAAQWARLGTELPLPWNAIAAVLLGVLLLSGIKACADWRRDPRHGLLVMGCLVPGGIWLVWLPHDFFALAALPCLTTLAAMGIRLYPRWARQLWWAAVVITYGWSHWQAV